MKTRGGQLVVVGAALLMGIPACKNDEKSGEAAQQTAKSQDQGRAVAEAPKPDITTSVKELTEEYAADYEATDKKYKGKRVLLTGDIVQVSVVDDKAYVRLVGAAYTDTKLAAHRQKEGYSERGSVEVSCMTKPTTYVEFMAKSFGEELSQSDKKPVGTVSGVYDDKSYPASNAAPTIQLKDCSLIEPKK